MCFAIVKLSDIAKYTKEMIISMMNKFGQVHSWWFGKQPSHARLIWFTTHLYVHSVCLIMYFCGSSNFAMDVICTSTEVSGEVHFMKYPNKSCAHGGFVSHKRPITQVLRSHIRTYTLHERVFRMWYCVWFFIVYMRMYELSHFTCMGIKYMCISNMIIDMSLCAHVMDNNMQSSNNQFRCK